MVAQALFPGRPEDGGHDTFSPPDRHRSAPCTSGRRWPWHIQWRFCSPDVRRIRMPMSDQSSFPSQICALPARRMAAQARSAAILCTARPKVGGPGTFSGHDVSRLPGGGWLWHVLPRLCSLPSRRMAALARSAAILCPARPKVGGPGTFSGHSVPCLP